MRKEVKGSVNETIIIIGTGLATTILAGVFFQINGYPPVVTATEELAIKAPPLYMLPIFFPFGILLGEVSWRWIQEEEHNLRWLLLIECIGIAILATLRIITDIPFSGHALILCFYLLHQIFTNKHQYPFRVLLGIILLIQTIMYKVFLWDDPITLFLGVILGLTLWVSGFFFQQAIGIKEVSDKD